VKSCWGQALGPLTGILHCVQNDSCNDYTAFGWGRTFDTLKEKGL